jgi:hypothetical protein
MTKNKDDKYTIIGALSVLALVGAGVLGWIMNVLTIAHTIDAPLSGMLILRVLGVVIPILGAVLGYV